MEDLLKVADLKKGPRTIGADTMSNKTVLLYFSASWCGPCCDFTPEFANFYKKHAASKKFEVVFVPWDEDENAYNEYFQKMPWAALPMGGEAIPSLNERFGIDSIPSIVVLNGKTLDVYTKEGRTKVSEDPQATSFPWAEDCQEGGAEQVEMEGAGECMAIADLLQFTEIPKGKKTVTTESLSGKTVLLYFSASWCGPCTEFTPELIKFYKTHSKEKDFEVILVPWDENSDEFDAYYAKMPWASLPCGADVIPSLNEKFAVEGIPTLVALNGGTCEVYTSDATTKVQEDPEGNFFPWECDVSQMTLEHLLEVAELQKGDSTITTEEVSGKTVLLYFSASWCGPCVEFTPEFVKFYKKHAKKKNLEVIFIPWDEEQSCFDEYYAKMPWATLPCKAEVIQSINSMFEVDSIPTVIVLNGSTLEVFTKDGRGKIEEDPDAENFPWKEE